MGRPRDAGVVYSIRAWALRRAMRVPRVREPFYGVFEPHTRRVYVNDPDNIAGVGALLDAIPASGR
jgi:hypothetical protein